MKLVNDDEIILKCRVSSNFMNVRYDILTLYIQKDDSGVMENRAKGVHFSTMKFTAKIVCDVVCYYTTDF